MANRKSKLPSLRSQAIKVEKRRAATVLRKAGVLRRKQGRLTDKYLRESSHFRKVRREFRDLLNGTAKLVLAPPKTSARLRAAGYKVKRNKVLVPREIRSSEIKRKARELPPVPTKVEREHDFEDCLKKIKEWFVVNFDPRFSSADLEKRIDKLERQARKHKNVFRQVVNASNLQGELYLSGQPMASNPWPSGKIADLFIAEFTELYYYHPTDWAPDVAGGLIPRC